MIMLTSFHLNPEVTNPDTLFDAGDPMKMMGFQSLFEKCEVSGILFFNGNEKEKILQNIRKWPQQHESLRERFVQMVGNSPRIVESNEKLDVDGHVQGEEQDCRHFGCEELFQISKFEQSKISKKMTEYHQGGIQLAETNPERVVEIFNDFLRYSDDINYFDAVIGKIRHNMKPHYKESILWVLKTWKEIRPTAKKFTIFTTVPHQLENINDNNKIDEAEEANEKKIQEVKRFIKQIENESGLRVRVYFKRDPHNRLHDRKLEHRYGIITLGMGLNLGRRGEERVGNHFRDNTINLAMHETAKKQIRDCKRLENYD